MMAEKTFDDSQHVEDIIGEDIHLSIEDTDTSKAAWLISVTVSMGGFLFGAPCFETNIPRTANGDQAMTLASSLLS